jgi:hypothetical protein
MPLVLPSELRYVDRNVTKGARGVGSVDEFEVEGQDIGIAGLLTFPKRGLAHLRRQDDIMRRQDIFLLQPWRVSDSPTRSILPPICECWRV